MATFGANVDLRINQLESNFPIADFRCYFVLRSSAGGQIFTDYELIEHKRFVREIAREDNALNVKNLDI